MEPWKRSRRSDDFFELLAQVRQSLIEYKARLSSSFVLSTRATAPQGPPYYCSRTQQQSGNQEFEFF